LEEKPKTFGKKGIFLKRREYVKIANDRKKDKIRVGVTLPLAMTQ